MSDFKYSVIIRTTGQAGEKFAGLLECIRRLEPEPQETIVVLPEGYSIPEEMSGTETVYFCPKGMVRQRLHGIEKCRTRYALITDDDIAFAPDFAEKLSVPVSSGAYGFSAGPLPGFFPPSGIRTAVSAIMGSAVPTIFHKDRYNSVLKTTGYSYNRKIDIGSDRFYETQTAPWTCFFADLEALRSIHFEDEMWLDAHGYSSLDDETMFYKAWLCGKRTVVAASALYEHLDAKTAVRGNSETARYAAGFNLIVFWRRFLYEERKTAGKIWCRICLSYRIGMQRLYNRIDCMRGRMTREERLSYLRGIADAKKWVKSEEYENLPPIRR